MILGDLLSSHCSFAVGMLLQTGRAHKKKPQQAIKPKRAYIVAGCCYCCCSLYYRLFRPPQIGSASSVSFLSLFLVLMSSFNFSIFICGYTTHRIISDDMIEFIISPHTGTHSLPHSHKTIECHEYEICILLDDVLLSRRYYGFMNNMSGGVVPLPQKGYNNTSWILYCSCLSLCMQILYERLFDCCCYCLVAIDIIKCSLYIISNEQ